MLRRALYFTAPRAVEVQSEDLHGPGLGEILVETILSAISSGSELLVYRGEAPRDIPVDLNISALGGSFTFPLKYGYSAVGRVIGTGPGVDSSWLDRLVFSFQPHQSHFVAKASEVVPLPDGVAPEDAVFLPNVETAVNLVMDGAPLAGECVVVLGQGVVGLLTSAILFRFPVLRLITMDTYEPRRKLSLSLGAEESLDPADPLAIERIGELLSPLDGADLVYELSGNPSALDLAVDVCGFSGRIVVGSWYGRKRVSVDLGGKFHRSRIRMVSSQVSTVSPELSGRWTKARRLAVAWRMLSRIEPSRFITGRFPLEGAQEAFRILDEEPSRHLQIVIEY